MKQSLRKGLAMIAALTGTAGTAHAQSSVMLYGRIDNGIAFVDHASGDEDLVALRHALSNSRFGNAVYR